MKSFSLFVVFFFCFCFFFVCFFWGGCFVFICIFFCFCFLFCLGFMLLLLLLLLFVVFLLFFCVLFFFVVIFFLGVGVVVNCPNAFQIFFYLTYELQSYWMRAVDCKPKSCFLTHQTSCHWAR